MIRYHLEDCGRCGIWLDIKGGGFWLDWNRLNLSHVCPTGQMPKSRLRGVWGARLKLSQRLIGGHLASESWGQSIRKILDARLEAALVELVRMAVAIQWISLVCSWMGLMMALGVPANFLSVPQQEGWGFS